MKKILFNIFVLFPFYIIWSLPYFILFGLIGLWDMWKGYFDKWEIKE